MTRWSCLVSELLSEPLFFIVGEWERLLVDWMIHQGMDVE
jgi:hypothetical protein